ncbi:uncharacterized protein LOC109285748 [Alligator mississippiensis]|uniref:uncharacterized protein LOC109285748 n=1 Tax=Alligator mississippiensis TaxID=8496 RepID=UPI0028776D2B|nr:uncharacterized protein LOC109285748 [Alligator mississippiensis]
MNNEIISNTHHHNNLSLPEKKAIESLRSNHQIVIKRADKGGAIVILNCEDYIKEANRQLSDTTYYKEVQEDPTPLFTKKLNNTIKSFPSRLQKNPQTLIPPLPNPGTFYLLPKIHKQGDPGSPIISNHGTLTEEISDFVESILKPLVTHRASFVQDTKDFLRKFKNIDHLPSNTLLATTDVPSLYTNIPHQDGIQACLTYLQEQDYNSEYRPKDITDLIHFILTHNNFTFNNQHFLQMMGTGMGTKMAPQNANLFMSHLEEDFLKNCTIKPLLYLRYIHDIFIIWTENLQSLIEFHQKFNNRHPSIQLSLE